MYIYMYTYIYIVVCGFQENLKTNRLTFILAKKIYLAGNNYTLILTLFLQNTTA